MAATLGVATWSYAPYAVFSYVSPLLTIALAYAGFRMLRLAPIAIRPDAGSGPPATGPNQLT
jgi:NhaC family Na+:H+ antiporter